MMLLSLLVSFQLFAASEPKVPPKEEPDIFACARTEECVAAFGACQTLHAVNSGHLEFFKEQSRKAEMHRKCLTPAGYDLKRAVAVCRSGRCRIEAWAIILGKFNNCRFKEDCIVVPGFCRVPTAVSRYQISAHREWVKKKTKDIEGIYRCEPPVAQPSNAQPADCVEGACQLSH